MQYDTIVVGLGAAGVTAASTLAKAGRKVLGLEAQNRIGGRVNTVPFGDGVVELGAEWIHGEHPSRVYDAAVQNNVRLKSQDLSPEVLRSDGTRANSELIGELVEYCFDLMEAGKQPAEPLGPYLTRKLKEHLKATNPQVLEDEDFVQELLHHMDLIVDNLTGASSWDEVSTFSPSESADGDQHLSWHRNGYKTFFELLLNTYHSGTGLDNLDIRLNSEVTRIVWPQEPGSSVEVTCQGGEVHRASNVIVTVSVGVLKDRHTGLFTPPLPEDKVHAIENLDMGVMDKIVFSFEQPWWPKSTTSFGFLWRSEDKNLVAEDDHWTTKIFGAITPLGSSNTLTLWTSGETGKMVETLPEEVVKRKCMELLQKFFGAGVTIPEPTGMHRTTWYSNPFTRGSYTFDSVTSMKYPDSRAVLGRPLVDSAGTPRVLFAGEATDLTYFSTVHGASDSGYREAMRLLPPTKSDTK